MAITQIAVVSVPVSDQDAAKHFYVDLLGLELVADRSLPGMRWLQVAPPGSPVSLTLVTWFPSMPAGSLQGLVLRSGDLQADYERLAAAGVRFEGPPHAVPHAVAETVVRDPDGNGIVLQQV
jgi:catechol 2,3-dioxygenase-like lactoylglutathione lyase family enzyme